MGATEKKEVTAIIQARLGSTRLPAKIMADIRGKPMLLWVLERVAEAKRIDNIVVATTTLDEDRAVANRAESWGFGVFRGSAEDVLSRYFGAAEQFKCCQVVRITSDCPLIDPQIADLVIGEHLDGGYDYTSNTLDRRTYPRGLDVECFTFETLRLAADSAREDYQKEHVTPYIFENPEMFSLHFVPAPANLAFPEMRICVDTIEDLEAARTIFEAFPDEDKGPDAAQVVRFLLEHPEVIEINTEVKQKELRQ
ncbi:MAG: glycosyltransferase family protein [Actinobacteria bacterium]|nr:glycosyltransferase family protein [Actinomycetota bacterium]